MKTLTTKVVLSALAITALVASPAFAKSHHVVNQDNAAVGYVDAAPGYFTAAPGSDIPAYDSQGGVVGISNPDHYGLQSQR